MLIERVRNEPDPLLDQLSLPPWILRWQVHGRPVIAVRSALVFRVVFDRAVAELSGEGVRDTLVEEVLVRTQKPGVHRIGCKPNLFGCGLAALERLQRRQATRLGSVNASGGVLCCFVDEVRVLASKSPSFFKLSRLQGETDEALGVDGCSAVCELERGFRLEGGWGTSAKPIDVAAALKV